MRASVFVAFKALFISRSLRPKFIMMANGEKCFDVRRDQMK